MESSETEPQRSRRLDSLGQLAGGIAHDFNNLLGVILNCSTLLGRRLADEAALADLLEIHLAAEQAVGLTRQLLAVASCEPAEPVSLELNEMVRGIARAIKLSLGDQVQLRVEIDSDPLVCLVDERQFTHIVTALAANAVDAMPAGGELTIRLRRSTDESVVLEVVDTGCGMTADVVGRAFEPFFTTKPRESGTGLGLAMVYGQVRQNAGEVTIRSTPGVGSSVAVVLPGHDPAEDRAADHAGAGLN